jgi:hypothetical protein
MIEASSRAMPGILCGRRRHGRQCAFAVIGRDLDCQQNAR